MIASEALSREVFEKLENDVARDFVLAVRMRLRRLTDRQVNDLFLMSFAGELLGEPVGEELAALRLPIEKEWELRRDIAIVPRIGPVIAPELYVQGGPHDLPF